MRKLLVLFLTICLLASTNAKTKDKVPVWTDAETATKEHPGFAHQGDYVKAGVGVQATVLKDGKFLVATFQGGLPGAGWDKSKIKSEVLDTAQLKSKVASFTKALRTSPTMGRVAPENAIMTMADGFTNVKDGILWAGGKTKKDVGSFKMHVEFMLPFKPARNPSNQDRGNSGLYIFNNYEIQVIDSYGLDFDSANNAIPLESVNKQWCGCFYKMKLADTHMAFPPLTWQTYDIEFTAPVFKDGKKVKNAFITVAHNGVKIHDNFELKTGTGAGAKRKQLAKGPIYFQNHGNPTMFRNVWIVEK
ncbi:MAG: DUF1080 domain-containing protein [Lentisphaeraceae bacterium]|nr:DUF1080 domain-containing protein [Lentisphaeraceae bacterium]